MTWYINFLEKRSLYTIFSHMIKESMIQIESIWELFYNQKKWLEHVSCSISPTYKFFCPSLLIKIDKNDSGRTNIHLNSANALSFCSENLHFTRLIYSQKMRLSVVNIASCRPFFPFTFQISGCFYSSHLKNHQTKAFKRGESEANLSHLYNTWPPGKTNKDHYKSWLVHLHSFWIIDRPGLS